MQASLIHNRDCYDVTYENSTGDGSITAVFENPADGDKSVYAGIDDGTFVVTVSKGYVGESNCTITHETGEELDSGLVTFGAAAEEE